MLRACARLLQLVGENIPRDCSPARAATKAHAAREQGGCEQSKGQRERWAEHCGGACQGQISANSGCHPQVSSASDCQH